MEECVLGRVGPKPVSGSRPSRSTARPHPELKANAIQVVEHPQGSHCSLSPFGMSLAKKDEAQMLHNTKKKAKTRKWRRKAESVKSYANMFVFLVFCPSSAKSEIRLSQKQKAKKKNTHRSSVGKLTVEFKEKKERT